MIRDLALFLIFGKPLIMYSGILTFLFLIFTALIGFLNFKGISIIPFKWHPKIAVLTIVLAIIHAILGLSMFFSF